jgi:hypothetical protein
MGITHIPQQVAGTVQDAASSVKYQLEGGWEKNWVRTVAAGSLVTGAILLATGKRRGQESLEQHPRLPRQRPQHAEPV